MSSIQWFGWLKGGGKTAELPDIFPFPFKRDSFIDIDVRNIYTRILTDVIERTAGIPSEKQKLLWDNCLGDESQDGLITMIAKAMVEKRDLFLRYDQSIELIRRATPEEANQIRLDYADPKKGGKSSVGTFITFKNYDRTDMVKLYSGLEFLTVGSLSKSMNLSKAVQFKIAKLRESTGLTDSADVIKQVVALAEALRAGRDIMTDGADIIETAKPDLTATESAMDFIAKKQSFYLGLPASWITGLAAKGLGDSGEGDTRAVERGLKPYYFSIIKPVIEALFQVKTTFKSGNIAGLTMALDTLRTFEATSNELISRENKQTVVNSLFDLDPDATGDEPEAPAVPPPAPGGPARDVTPPAGA